MSLARRTGIQPPSCALGRLPLFWAVFRLATGWFLERLALSSPEPRSFGPSAAPGSLWRRRPGAPSSPPATIRGSSAEPRGTKGNHWICAFLRMPFLGWFKRESEGKQQLWGVPYFDIPARKRETTHQGWEACTAVFMPVCLARLHNACRTPPTSPQPYVLSPP